MKYNKGGVAVILAIILAIGALSFGSYKVFHKTSAVSEEQSAIISGNLPADYKPADHKSPSTATTVPDSNTYRNTRYGYELTLSNSWKDHQIVENPDGTVDLKVRTSTGEYWGLYKIVAVDIKEWDKDVAACSKMSPEDQDSPTCHFITWKIARNDKYVFMAMSAQDFPHEMDLAHSDFWQKIAPTFKFI